MSYINEALLGTSPWKKQQAETKGLVEKWDKTGLLDGLNEEFQKNGMAVMLENQAKQLVQEASYTNQAHGTAGGDEEWSGVALPLVRRIFGEIAAQEFVSVQPMNLPSGLVFYLDFKYGTTTDRTRATNESIHGKQGKWSPSGSSAPYGTDGFYGAGRYEYSMNPSKVTWSAATSASITTEANFGWDAELSNSIASEGGTIYKFTVARSGLTREDELAVRAFRISGSQIDNNGTYEDQLSQLNYYDDTNVYLYASASTTSDDAEVLYFEQPTDSTRGDFEDTAGDATTDSLGIPEVNLELTSRAIVAKTRKLKAVWSPELAQDLNAYHSIDAEAELTSMLSEYISMEIDLEILDMLITDAATTEYWSASPNKEYDASVSDFVVTAGNSGAAMAYTKFDWWQTLVAKIQKVSNEIHKLTLRGGANFVVVSPTVATILESLPGYMVDTDGTKNNFAMGVQKIGAIHSRFNVYKNPYMTENQILVGFRGGNFFETGAVYAPYVPLIMTPLVYDPSDFTPRKGVMTRYAKKMVRPEFYGKIQVADLDLV